MDEKQGFSERLRSAMRGQKLEASAAVLERVFNQIWEGGKPVRRQTVWKWLNAQTIPTQDKLQELARLLKVDAHHLRYGGPARQKLSVQEPGGSGSVSYLEHKTIEAFLQLPEAQKKIVREVIQAFSKAFPTKDGNS